MRLSRYHRIFRIFLLAAVVLAIPAASFAGVFISIGIAPPPLPVYAQPVIPAPGYIWTPGYWAWAEGGYYWVPGTWVQPPQVGVLWTPGYWGWGGGAYLFHAGYWGPHIGFYGGVNYGYGYGGVGYEGGYWNHGAFAYNRSVNNISNVHITNVYNHTVINNTTVNRTSFNGGAGGIQAQPSVQEQAAVRENHFEPTSAQVQHVNQAQSNPALRASVNGGKPPIAATARPGEFNHAVPAREAGGQVDTAAYKAAAENGGRLPANVRDPGGNATANRTVNTASARPETRPGANGEAAQPRPNNQPEAAAKPATTERAQPEARPAPAERPETAAKSETEPRAEAKAYSAPEAKPEPAARPEESSRPEAQSKPEKTHSAPESKPESKPKQQHSQSHSQPKHESSSHENKPKGK